MRDPEDVLLELEAARATLAPYARHPDFRAAAVAANVIRRAAEAEAARDRAVALLRKVEWVDCFCPFCGMAQRHAAHCELPSLLGAHAS